MSSEALWDMERNFWLDGAAFYESSMAPDARMVFPSPVGILAGEQIVEGLRRAPRWSSVDFHDETKTSLGETVVLAYSATGRRDGEDPYEAFCASTYVQHEGRWVLLAHQQTSKS
tara:strand:- start:406 stop:750 length:345 start_codon:yes stop_codon:yes gene_type:complete